MKKRFPFVILLFHLNRWEKKMNEHASIHYNFTQDHLKLITNPFEN